jgi:DNA-directed RNA polymerase
MTQLSGGYLSLRTKAVMAAAHSNAHSAALDKPIQGASLEALNWIQKTRWAINRDVLRTAQACRALGAAFEGFPSYNEDPLPAIPEDIASAGRAAKTVIDDLKAKKVDKDLFPAQLVADLKAWTKAIRDRKEAHDENARNYGMRRRLNALLDTAQAMTEFPAIWFPHYADFRGRFYPRPQDLHTQGDSLVKGLLQFSESVKLGTNGQYWLYVSLASCFGKDKLHLDDRAAWTAENMVWILRAAEEPMDNMDFWAKSDSPWETLAACFEVARLYEWMKLGNSPQDFEQHVPVRLDATCSGIQHLAAMMKDESSARRVNVLPVYTEDGKQQRADIYTDVKDQAAPRVVLDAVNGSDKERQASAAMWVGKVVRDTVKRAVMTTPYGVGERGIQTQLVKGGLCDDLVVPEGRTEPLTGKERYAAAGYMTEVIVEALEGNIAAPRAALDYFRKVADHLDAKDTPLVWDTPSGFTVKQAYHKADRQRVKTLGGEVLVYLENVKAGFVPGKQVLGAAPNVVHSFDAAHLALTCVAMKREGVRDMAFVHDSFGCHAGNVDLLLKHTKEQFVAIYNTDTLEQWRQSVIKHSGVLDIPEVPTLGNLDVTRVLDSEFFFS